jgi:hypothetical protein
MISSETPYKLAEIIRDTWPGLYRKSNNQSLKLFDDNKNKQYDISNNIVDYK